MSYLFANAVYPPAVFANEVSIISRREIEPLLAKARRLLASYTEAMKCSSAVLDRTGLIIKTPEYKKQMKFCEFCRKYCRSHVKIWEGNEYPCSKLHAEAVAMSRRMEGSYVYSCEAGFVYWISALYRNKRYAGSVMAGQVLPYSPARAADKFSSVFKDKIAAEKFKIMLEDVPVRNHDEIQAMAQVLGLCAGEISEKENSSGNMLRRLAWQVDDFKNLKEPSDPDRQPSQESCQAEKERLLLAAYRRGDSEKGRKILNELMDDILKAIPDNLEIFRGRAIELLVLLSRAAASTEASDAITDANNRYLKRIQESETTEELTEILHMAADRMAGNIFSFQGIRHASVLRRAERYIWENYTRKISLDEIARASGLSAPYFSTIFKEEMGENLSCYLNRLRVERAAALLRETTKSLNEIAALCGFEDQSWFSKIFKNFSGTSPGKYRETANSYTAFAPVKKQLTGEMSFPVTAVPKRGKEAMLSTLSLG